MRAALCGNPNVGKTTLFNRLTRSSAPVGNWHGVTVDVKQKKITGTDVVLSDLPGCYSLTSRSFEESVTRDGVLGGYDVVLFVAEVNNLRRNLYLFTQIAETGARVALIVNMLDEARGKVDLDLLSERLGVPVVGTSERMKNPRADVLDAIAKARVPRLTYLQGLEIPADIVIRARKNNIPPCFAALKLEEGDGYIAEMLGVERKERRPTGCGACGGCGAADRDRPAALRYAFIDGALVGVVSGRRRYSITDKIDRIVVGKAALPVFFLVMTAVFAITFEVARPLSDMLARLVALAAAPVKNADMPAWLCGFLGDGVICGAGAVLSFLPQVTLLFLLTTLLQDSGYMSRVAFVSDGFFKKFGLSGRAAFSLLLGLGCSATAVLSTRGIASKSARRRAALATPFVPCSARLSVFTAISAYFGLSALTVAAMYVLGFCAALVALKIMRVVGGESGGEELLMEMPPYRIPSLKRTVKAVLQSVGAFVVRVGSVVLGVGAAMWLLSNFSVRYGFTGGGDKSIMSTFAGAIAPLFSPLGFGDWRAVTALISGVAAKETLVSVMSSLGGVGAVLGNGASAMSFLIFSCLYVPCVATIATLIKEAGAKYAALSAAVHTVIAYVASLAFYQTALLWQTDKKLPIIIWSIVATVVAVACIASRVRKAKAKKRVEQKR